MTKIENWNFAKSLNKGFYSDMGSATKGFSYTQLNSQELENSGINKQANKKRGMNCLWSLHKEQIMKKIELCIHLHYKDEKVVLGEEDFFGWWKTF